MLHESIAYFGKEFNKEADVSLTGESILVILSPYSSHHIAYVEVFR